MSEEPQRRPLVFISYSHDSREHKIWVLEFAQKLVSHGVDVKFDQWDLGFGDDVVKFMERWVKEAERVLMICTETYVQKANDGKGGAGYEAMIVTGELVNDLGTKKFVPVVRQKTGSFERPTSVSTRKAVNFSEDADFNTEFEGLVRELHAMPPASKPAFGHAPVTTAPALPSVPLKVSGVEPGDPIELYEHALNLARSGDLVSWRRLIESKKTAIQQPLLIWREKQEKAPAQDLNQLFAAVREGLAPYSELFAVVLAGVESCQPRFNQQSGLVHDLIEPREWAGSGITTIVGLPETAAFLFQATLGSMAVYTEQAKIALDLAGQRISRKYAAKSEQLYMDKGLIGWPDGLGGNCVPAWRFLWELPEMWSWVSRVFGSANVYRESLCGYYLLLSWVEFIGAIRDGLEPKILTDQISPDVPSFFYGYEQHVAGMRRLLADHGTLIEYSQKANIPISKQIELWPKWAKMMRKWVNAVTNYGFRSYDDRDVVKHFVEDLNR